MAWRFSAVDKGGPFAWSVLNEGDEFREVFEKLHQFETMEQAAIARGGSHTVEASQFSSEARKRLIEIQHDDVDELMSFRVGGKPRVWCRVAGNIMSVLWWDPEHRVCPSMKKGT